MTGKPTYEELEQRVRELERAESEGLRAEETLRRSEERFNLAIEGTGAGLWDWEMDNDRVIYSKQWKKMLGYEDHEVEDSFAGWKKLWHPDDRERIEKAMEDYLSGKTAQYEIVHRLKHKDGHWRWILTRGGILKDRSGRPYRWIGTNIDITEWKRIEEALRDYTEFLRKVLDASPNCIFIKDREQRFFMVNEAAASLYGLPMEKILGKTDMELAEASRLRRTDLKDFSREDPVVLAKQQTESISEKCFIEPDGTRKWFQTIKIPLETRMTPNCLLGVAMDITERKQAEKKLRQIEKAESLSRMAGAIAHFFNNQLNVVMGYLEMALDAFPENFPQRRHLLESYQAARRSAETSALMLAYIGQTTEKGEPIDLSDVCRQKRHSLQGVVTEGIALETDFSKTGLTIHTSDWQIQQIISNLLTNAVEAIGNRRGKIKLATKSIAAEDIILNQIAPPDWKPQASAYACLEVADSGCGIETENMEKIFDPFFSTKFTGRGLGLAVVLGITRRWRGAIDVKSKKGSGTTVRVVFPLVDDAVPVTSEKRVPVEPISPGGTILLVEDDESIRNMTTKYLEFIDYSVLSASDGFSAVELFNHHCDKICCVITDLTMPRMNGWETIAALRRIDPDIPVILASGYDEASVMGSPHADRRPQAFLQKPYVLGDLRAALAVVRKTAPRQK